MSTNINIPKGPFIDLKTGRITREWYLWLLSPQFLRLNLSYVLDVTSGGTGLASGTDGGIPGFVGTTTLKSSVLLTQNALLLGGGAGNTPFPLASLGTASTLLHGNVSGTPTWGQVALGSEVSGTLPVTNGGTNSNTALSGQTIMVSNGTKIVQGSAGTTTTVLHGNASGAPSYAAIALTTDVTGILPVANGGTGVANANANTVFAGPLSGSASPPSFQVRSVIKCKLSATSRTSTTVLTDDPDLVFPIGANETWCGRIFAYIGAALHTTGMQMTIAAPTGATGDINTSVTTDGTSGQENDMLSSATLGASLDFSAFSGSANNGWMEVVFLVVNGSTAGNVSLQWAQSVSSATPLTFNASAQLKADRLA